MDLVKYVPDLVRVGMDMFTASTSRNMESTAVGQAPKAAAPLLGRRPKTASQILDVEAVNMAMATHTRSERA